MDTKLPTSKPFTLKERLRNRLRTKEIQRLSKKYQTKILEKACEKKGIKKDEIEKLFTPQK